MLLTLCVINQAYAAVSLGATRVIYFAAGEKQVKLPVINNDEKRYI